jgi:outer membrane protein assembly factor BamB
LYLSGIAIPGKGMHNVLIVATEHDSLCAFDADTGAQLWHTSLLPTGETPSDDRGCSQVTPENGITSTPVIDRTMGPHGTIFAVTMSKDGAGNYHHRIHSVDLTTGLEQVTAREVQATYTGSGAEGDGSQLTFDPKQHKDRSALAHGKWSGVHELGIAL